MDAVERERQVRRFVEAVWYDRDYDAAADLFADDFVNPFGSGPAARVEPIRHYHQAFPDLRLDIEEWIGADKLGLFIQLGVVDNPWPA